MTDYQSNVTLEQNSSTKPKFRAEIEDTGMNVITRIFPWSGSKASIVVTGSKPQTFWENAEPAGINVMVQLSVPSPPETVETFAQALLVATRICRGENPARMAEIGAITTIE